MDDPLTQTAQRIRQRDWDGAITAAQAALADGRALPRAAARMLAGLVVTLGKSGRADAAAALADRLLPAAPREPSAYLARSGLAQRVGDLAMAIADTRAAMDCSADPSPAWPRLADLLYEAGELEEAEATVHRALARSGEDLELLARLVEIVDARGALDALAIAVERALAQRRQQGFGSPRLLMALLKAGRLEAAFPDLDLRWALAGAPPRPFPQPAWKGEAAPDRTLLVWGEQGLGEEIWASALLAEAAARVGRVVLECAPRLAALFARSFPAFTVAARQDPPAPEAMAADIQCGAVDLLRALDARAFSHAPPLRADPAAAAGIRARYRRMGSGPIVGLSWRSANRRAAAAKSSSLADWGPILARPAVFIDLQYGDTDGDRAMARTALGVDIHRDPAIDPLGDLDGVAAQVAALDAVVTVSNTTAHVAGGLGVPSAVLLARGRGQVWSWFDGATPWYAGQRICRQERAGDWQPAIQAAGVALDQLLAGRR
ncbi:hypothetical protein EDC65_2884 [Stella humosa]|uniref:Uncharacterized protein n=1 Tax=Stella humosa TaxID=94 RepID=A0A3N1LIN8_9PROT|nr:hypothetical protein [Stella humosa]ROP91024.1 hypothetical protein EDC65_2884 [Stella humosa]BBK34626.1 hypothetical protein STHU_52600 [Stella humosa]